MENEAVAAYTTTHLVLLGHPHKGEGDYSPSTEYRSFLVGVYHDEKDAVIAQKKARVETPFIGPTLREPDRESHPVMYTIHHVNEVVA